MIDPVIDLLLGGTCVGCGRPGRSLCGSCEALLPDTAWPAWPTPTPAGLAPPWSSASYDGLVRAVLLAHKERHVGGLAAPLARLLAVAVAAAAPGPWLMVPVPGRPGAARARGHEPLLDVCRRAARLLPGARVTPLLRSRGGVVDQAGLSSAARAANLAGSMWCPAARLRRLSGRTGHVVICDDVLTTGSTVREAQRALGAVGLATAAIATVAATPRRPSGGPGTGRIPTHRELSGARLSREGVVD